MGGLDTGSLLGGIHVITGGPLLSSGGRTDPKGSGSYDFNALKALWEKHATGAAAKPGVSTVAAAIALAESGGDPNAGASHPYHGLWQVGPGGSFDPDTNAKEAIAKYNASHKAKGDGFLPWTTYTGADTPNHEKTYKKFLPKNFQGLPGSAVVDAGKGVVNAGKDAVNGVSDVGTFVTTLASHIFDPHWWLRVGLILGGIALLLMGLAGMVKQFMPPMPPIPLPI